METKTERDVQVLVETWQRELAKAIEGPTARYLAARAVLVPAGNWTEDEAKRAADRLVIPETYAINREPDGRPEVWGQDLFSGTYWVIYVRQIEP